VHDFRPIVTEDETKGTKGCRSSDAVERKNARPSKPSF
jgi:hypothetical protein